MRALLVALGEPGPVSPAIVPAEVPVPSPPPIAVPVDRSSESAAPEAPRAVAVPLPELTLGRTRPSPVEPAPASPERPSAPDAELPTIEAHLRLKADGARWAANRRRLMDRKADFREEIAPNDRALSDRSRALPDCHLWMNTASAPEPVDPSRWDEVASGFDTAAEGVALIRAMLADPTRDRDDFAHALDLLAEAQSAVRAVVDRVGGSPDPDQYRAYEWLRAPRGESSTSSAGS